jgi:5-(carboxyamino)imidazole ribonucleotide synthase
MKTLLPGATIGILGGGQLGRMFTIAAKQLGYNVHIFSPEENAPAAQVGAVQTKGDYSDLELIRQFSQKIDVLTFEFENVSAEAAEVIAKFVPVRPEGSLLYTTQNRLREKTFLDKNAFPVTPFAKVNEDAESILKQFACKAIIKTSELGYDGKGQAYVDSPDSLKSAFNKFGKVECILEKMIDLDLELSVIVARNASGESAVMGPFGNTHKNHILDITVYPMQIADKIKTEALEIARGVADKFNLVGILCLEFFLDKSGNLMINELAPRTHNSGHLTIDAFVTSQFEQHVRAVCNLPLGSTNAKSPAAMVNLLGDLWGNGEPNWLSLKDYPQAKLHLYGKTEARIGRKMGHLTICDDSAMNAAEIALAARNKLAS